MPTKFKQVRFAYQNTVYPSYIPPPLTHSVSTVPSSVGPITPPNLSHQLPAHYPVHPKSAHPSHPPVSRYTEQMSVHPYLSMDGVVWDLMDSPASIVRNGHTVGRALLEPATQPLLPFLTISHPRLPWIFKVYASNGRYVTLGDVLDNLYRGLRINVTQPEFGSLPDKDRRRATRAYEDRYRRLRSRRMYEEEKRGGMKRVDFLQGLTRFVGLKNNGRPDEWHLRVS